MFADYTYYTGTYGGTAIAEASFTLYGNRATAYINSIMPVTPETVTDNLKMAMCAVADEMYKDDTEHGGIQGENNDGYSVSYKGGTKTPVRLCYEAAMLYISDLMGRWL